MLEGPRIIVCFKYSLDVDEIQVDPNTNTPILEQVPRKISDFDKNALEAAIKLKEEHGGEVIAVTACSVDPSKGVKEALAMGADMVYIVSDPSIEDSDAFITSLLLAKAIKKIGTFDLIFCGEAAIDGFAGQVSAGLAEWLGIPQLSYVRKISLANGKVVVERTLEEGYPVLETPLPTLISVTGEINEPRIPSLMMIMKAGKKPTTSWTIEDLGLSPERVGGAGSPIEVTKLVVPPSQRKQILLEGETPQEVAEKLVEELDKLGILGA
ncbi:MAG: electron transfer flavoprotein subunit beta/FixA family protein [Candidatus Heimdallarchaeota archaeon]